MAKKTTATKREVVTQINPYEFMLILSPNLRETEITKKLKEIVGIIEKAGGRITKEDFWGKKALAYRINKFDEGIYMVYDIEMPNTFLKEFKDHLRIEKEVLRSMIIKLPADYVYTKYDIEESDKPRKKVEKKKVAVKPAPVVKPVVKEEKVEAKPEKEDEEKEDPSSAKATEDKTTEAPEEKTDKPKEEEKPASDDTAEPSGDAVKAEDLQPSEGDTEEKTTDEPPTKEEKEEEKPAPDMSKEEKKERKEEKEGYEDELDKKLDKILGDEDLNL